MESIFDTFQNPIAVGDLVAIVKWPCCGKYLGFVGKVSGFCGPFGVGGRANCCKQTDPGGGLMGAKVELIHAPLQWLKRIPPLDELEGTKTDEPIEEPA